MHLSLYLSLSTSLSLSLPRPLSVPLLLSSRIHSTAAAPRVLPALDGVADSVAVLKDLVVVAALKGLVAKEVNGLECAVLLHVLQAVRLVPPRGEHIKTDLHPTETRKRWSTSSEGREKEVEMEKEQTKSPLNTLAQSQHVPGLQWRK